jgi:predicted transcriptional regulator
VLDERSLMTAFLGCAPEDYKNRFGIPADLFMVNPVKLAEYGRSLHERLDGWPGVRHTKKTRAV